ncbi:MAG: hypothetical protein HYV09_03335 [Deltaproteobacteria bacterium]|nr:hypothetical protein [Deltaproteobacteria bacterium]
MAWLDEILRFVAHARKPDGSLEECRLDADGNLRVVVATDSLEPAWDDSPGFVAHRIVKATSGTLLHLSGYSESSGYLHVFDATALPADGTKPTLAPALLWSGWTIAVPLPPRGRVFKNGIVWAVSTTAEALTLDAAGRAFVNAQRT